MVDPIIGDYSLAGCISFRQLRILAQSEHPFWF